MKIIRVTNLRADFKRVCQEVYRGNIEPVVTCEGEPVVQLVHPSKTPSSTELTRVGMWAARDGLSMFWEEVAGKGGHIVITRYGHPRAIMVPYIEPEVA